MSHFSLKPTVNNEKENKKKKKVFISNKTRKFSQPQTISRSTKYHNNYANIMNVSNLLSFKEIANSMMTPEKIKDRQKNSKMTL